ncbi:DUF1320 domain-containing protein [Aliiroseovarius crassostreae]|uniref:gp436 family protein n=1 Tax=Aliiroseovarius crassostreae TaxID=154981 RepID=UPI0022012FA1|nr:DUF1320 domain-containing protein [Aliiroseovarius crassostreae]UWQ00849.1 DUF1320 domain-containing protein [Aliiroseovarius crassostreae]
MTYATQEDIIAAYSEDALYVADRDGDGVIDTGAVTKALEAASAAIDSYIGVRYTVPIEGGNVLLRDYCIDIALYRLALARDVQTDEHRRRFEDAVSALKEIARGNATLNLPVPADQDGENAAALSKPRPIVVGGPQREFTREKMRGL